jgi:hypothetical protein
MKGLSQIVIFLFGFAIFLLLFSAFTYGVFKIYKPVITENPKIEFFCKYDGNLYVKNIGFDPARKVYIIVVDNNGDLNYRFIAWDLYPGEEIKINNLDINYVIVLSSKYGTRC